MNRAHRLLLSPLCLLVLAACQSTEVSTPVDPAPIVETRPAEPPAPPRETRNADWPSAPTSGIGFVPAERGIAFEAFGQRVSSEEYDQGLREHLGDRPRTPLSEEQYRVALRERLLALSWLENQPLRNEPTFRAEARRAVRSALSEQIVERRAATLRRPVSDEDVRALYRERLAKFRTPEKARIRMIQVSTESECEAALARLRQGEEFAAVAAAMSQHASRVRGGEVDPFPRGTYGIDALEEAAFRLAPGDREAVTTAAGIFIVEKLATIPERTAPFDAVSADLRAELEAVEHRRARTEALQAMEAELSSP